MEVKTSQPATPEGDALSFVSPDAVIGQNATIGVGVCIPKGVTLGNGVSIRSHVVFATPEDPAADANVVIEDNVTIGEGSVIYPGVRMAAGAYVRPGTVVTRSIPPSAIVEGNPATIVGYVNTNRPEVQPVAVAERRAPRTALDVGGVEIFRFPVIPDLRGNLTVGEFEKQIPFAPLRYFMVYDVPSSEIRGEHAHHECHQFLICVRGSCSVVVDDGHKRAEVELEDPSTGLYIPPMVWGIQYKYSSDALLLVFASHHYDSNDYIRDYGAFLKHVAQGT
ncbi:dTDP-6-deoxy-3,4-keto-hexulose isomerase [Pandoraea iniqua]|uniref:dTDP-6-deoxy-3,4-keto-hexulose isomerase n=1 Tax=Pandoraea iniqua TaxID=2508288 RepID=A0A5E4REB4_9BURK|nr:WxcM-like domain-containing protein [Pandoraea iniqua]VVD60359.1 dTDP-6-deoxy-3,4-keto-hexulose isomerase [Pandoraea iniqua]VVE54587.1 dTDP-6-deoxy-3,4-keto-hexulose isomerase [Pandoraea iniqua]